MKSTRIQTRLTEACEEVPGDVSVLVLIASDHFDVSVGDLLLTRRRTQPI